MILKNKAQMSETFLNEQSQKLRQFLEKSKRALFFTGAGISTESGISDFRSKGGLWQRFQPVTIQEFLASDDKRREYWIYKKEVYAQARDAKPNLGHLTMAKIEKEGKAIGVVTQNIDGLHQRAGSKNVLELHGTTLEIICLSCGETGPVAPVYERIQGGEEIPLCLKCGGFLKPNTISFGQMLDPNVLQKASQWARDCDLFIAAGSTLVVEPAASIPRMAKEYGIPLVIINRDSTPLDFMADLVVHTEIGSFLSSAVSYTGKI